MSVCCYYSLLRNENEQVLLISCPLACAVITDELLMGMSSYS